MKVFKVKPLDNVTENNTVTKSFVLQGYYIDHSLLWCQD